MFMIGMWNIGKYQIYSRNVMFQYLHLSFQMNSRRRYFFVRRKTKSKKVRFESERTHKDHLKNVIQIRNQARKER